MLGPPFSTHHRICQQDVNLELFGKMFPNDQSDNLAGIIDMQHEKRQGCWGTGIKFQGKRV
jgi:hypothetical protein